MVVKNSIYCKMKRLLEQRFFRLLSEYSQRKVYVTEFTEAIEELATHLADFSINEQDYSVLLLYFFSDYIVENSYEYEFDKDGYVTGMKGYKTETSKKVLEGTITVEYK